MSFAFQLANLVLLCWCGSSDRYCDRCLDLFEAPYLTFAMKWCTISFVSESLKARWCTSFVDELDQVPK